MNVLELNDIKSKRDALNLTQKKMAEKLKCTETYYRLIESGKLIPSIKMMEDIMDRLELTMLTVDKEGFTLLIQKK